MKAQAKLITNKSNIAYLSGFTGSSGFMLLTKSKNYLFTDFRYIERAKNSIKKGIEIVDTTRMWRNKEELRKNWQKVLKKHRVKTLGVEESDLSVTRYKQYKKISGKIKFSNISGEIESTREVKKQDELMLIKKSQQINEKVFLEIKDLIRKHLKSGNRTALTEAQVAWKIREFANNHGAEDLSFDPIVGFGKNSAIVHHEPGKTKLKKGDIVLIDMGVKYQGYCSDMTRMIFTAKPTKLQEEVYNLVLKAQENAISQIKAGHTGAKADKFSRKIIEKGGYGEAYGHAGGHGIGLDIHETPSLSENYKKKLKENSVITIEPGIYLPGKFGVRIEDMIIPQKRGNKNLTSLKKSIKESLI